MPYKDPNHARAAHEARKNNVGLCQLCTLPVLAVTRIPNGDKEHVCGDHAEMFWRGLVQAAAATRELNTLVDAALETEFDENQEWANVVLQTMAVTSGTTFG